MQHYDYIIVGAGSSAWRGGRVARERAAHAC